MAISSCRIASVSYVKPPRGWCHVGGYLFPTNKQIHACHDAFFVSRSSLGNPIEMEDNRPPAYHRDQCPSQLRVYFDMLGPHSASEGGRERREILCNVSPIPLWMLWKLTLFAHFRVVGDLHADFRSKLGEVSRTSHES